MKKSYSLFDGIKNDNHLENHFEYLPNIPVHEYYAPLIPNSGDLVEVFERVKNLEDSFEILRVFLGREEMRTKIKNTKKYSYGDYWKNSKISRKIREEDILNSNQTVPFIKELFNYYFRDDLYGIRRSDDNIILSGGSTSEEHFGLNDILKECLHFAIKKDWYGYSSSLGRDATRESIALLESSELSYPYSYENVALSLGATACFASLFDFISLTTGISKKSNEKCLCVIPNYPPIVQAAAQRFNLELVPCESGNENNSLSNLFRKVSESTPLIFLQTAINPTGNKFSEMDIEKLITLASPNTLILLDECHEILNSKDNYKSLKRANKNVIRIKSLSKDFSAPGLKVGWFLASSTFIKNYYEYASTNFGSPSSIFYLLTEVIARFERWRNNNILEIKLEHLNEFEKSYNLNLDMLNRVYGKYKILRNDRNVKLINERNNVSSFLCKNNIDTITANFSVNLSSIFETYEGSYALFRDIHEKTNVSTYPGILTFNFSDPIVRLSPFIHKDINPFIEKLIQFKK